MWPAGRNRPSESPTAMRIDVGDRIAVEVIDRKGIGFSTVRVSGDASDRHPARLVLLRRHADMADETQDVDARSDVERGAGKLARILEDIDQPVTPSAPGSAVEKAQDALKESGAYYSALVAVVTTSHFVAAGIGNVNVQFWAKRGTQSILNPTTVILGRASLLSSALGLGFDPDRIQSADLSISSGDRIIVGVEADLAVLHPMGEKESPSEVLKLIRERMNFERSAIIGVIAAARWDRIDPA
jgi:hypothetical protein